MDNKTRKCFLYLLVWRAANRYYIGCRYALKSDGPSDLGIKYFTSSSKVKALWAYCPPDEIHILKESGDANEILADEYRMINECSAIKNPLFLNQSNGVVKRPDWQKGKVIPEKQKAKMSATARTRKSRGITPWNKGKTHSIETIEKIKVARARQTITNESRVKMAETKRLKRLAGTNTHKGFSVITKQRMSIAAKNRPPPSPEAVEKRRQSLLKSWAKRKAQATGI